MSSPKIQMIKIEIGGWISYWWKSKLLFFGSIILASTWLFEKGYLSYHKAEIQELERYNSYFYSHINEVRIETSKMSVWEVAYNENKNKINLNGLLSAQSNAIAAAEEAIIWGGMMNGRGINNDQMAFLAKAMQDTLRSNIDRGDIANLDRIFNSTMYQFDTTHIKDQSEYNNRTIKAEKSLSCLEIVFVVLYAIGFLLISFDKAKSAKFKEEEDEAWRGKIESAV
ncbi:MAG TPA: hypothetical protein VHK91_07870, partial [Flavisolibacter sp.]|nr:hypothetical protein [Flavisolibacter sp.]